MNKDIIKYAVLGVGAWYVWKTYMSGPTVAAAPTGGTTYKPPTTTTTPPTTTQPPASTTPPPTATTPPAMSIATLQTKLVAAAGRNDGLNFDQWNYYLAQILGKPGPAAEEAWPGADANVISQLRSTPIGVIPYITQITPWLTAQGMSGLGWMSLGDLAELGLWTSNRVPQQGWAGVERNPHFVWRT